MGRGRGSATRTENPAATVRDRQVLFANARISRGSFHPSTEFYVDRITGERVEVAVARLDFEVSAGQFALPDEERSTGEAGDLLFNDPADAGRMGHLSPDDFAARFSPAPTRPHLRTRADALVQSEDGTEGFYRPRMQGMRRMRPAPTAFDRERAEADRRQHVEQLADERGLAAEDVDFLVPPVRDPSKQTFLALRVEQPLELPASEVVGATGSTVVVSPGDWVSQAEDGRLHVVDAATSTAWVDAPREFPAVVSPGVAHPAMRVYHELPAPGSIDPGSLFLGADADAVARGRAAVAPPAREVVAARLDEPFEVAGAEGRPGDYLVQDPVSARLSIVSAERFASGYEQRPHPRADRRAVVEIDGQVVEVERVRHPDPGYCSIVSSVERDLMDAQRRAGVNPWRLSPRSFGHRVRESDAATRFPALFPDGVGPDTSD